MKNCSIIGFLTDFGQVDPYVGICKAVIAAINQHSTVIDISHEVTPQDILQAAFYLKAAAPSFPDGSIILAVVDPGVGSHRAPIVVENGAHCLVGPDNGIFDLIMKKDAHTYKIDHEKLKLALCQRKITVHESHTFHARDIFAPAAALISIGMSPLGFCTPIETPPKRLKFPVAKAKEHYIQGAIFHFDRFGNAATNISTEELGLLACKNRYIEVTIFKKDGTKIVVPFGQTFSSVPDCLPVSYINSFGLLEIAVNKGNAQKALGLHIGDMVKLTCNLGQIS